MKTLFRSYRKRMYLLFFMVIGAQFCGPVIYAQSHHQKTIVVKESDLTPDQLAKIKATDELDNLDERIKRFGKFAGMGKEIGTGVREAMKALGEFANTKVGEYTMFMIAWKVMYQDIFSVIYGFIFIIFGSIFIRRTQRTLYHRRIVVKKPPFFKRLVESTEYQVIEPADIESREWMKVLYIVCYVIMFLISYAIMF